MEEVAARHPQDLDLDLEVVPGGGSEQMSSLVTISTACCLFWEQKAIL